MVRRWQVRTSLILALALFACTLADTAQAGLGDKLKKKIGDKAAQKAGTAVDKATGAAEGATGGATGAEGAAAGEEGAGEESAARADGGAAAGAETKVSAVSTRFDYVPGDSVLFADDFTQDELGEFPARWKLSSGTFEVAEMNGERWLRCTSDDGHIRMKAPSSLPESWTLEFDAYGFDTGSYLSVFGLTADGNTAWETMFPYSDQNFSFRSGEVFSSTPLTGSKVTGRHHVMFMGRGTAVKAYIDRERLANVPDVTALGTPSEFDFRLWAPNTPVRPMITNVRFAEGCRPAKDMLAEGKLVTYGIFFDSGSDVVKPESAPILRQIAAYLEANPAVKLEVVGHTDNTGTAAGNLDLSKRRAASVARVLSEEFKIAADRFTTDGKGDTEAVASNASGEGRAMNRRVEFKKV